MTTNLNILKQLRNVFENTFYFTILGLILIIPSVLCLFYKCMVVICLHIKHGADYYGMMDGDETIWAVQERSMGQIITMFIHTFDPSMNGDILSAFKKHIDESMDLKETCPKLFCRRGYFMGYYYFYTDFTQKLTKPMRSYDSVDDLKRLLCEYGSSDEPLGDQDDGMMQLLIGTKEINWNGNDCGKEKKLYPVIVRTHHSLGDGVSLNCLFIKQLLKDPKESLWETYKDMMKMRKESATATKKLARHSCSLRKVFKYLKLLYALLRKERYAPPILRQYDSHILHGRSLSCEKNLVWNRDLHCEYVQKVKKIKKHIPGASFNSVILAAISASFNEYFCSITPYNVPKVITSSLVTLPSIPKFNQLVQLDCCGNIASLDMTNKYVICALKLPMTKGKNQLVYKERINQINEEIAALKNSLDMEILILCNRVIAKVLPGSCVKLLMRVFNTTFAISNLPGFAKGQLWHGGHIEDLYFWIPNSIDIGIGISIFSFKNKLEMGLIADKAIIPTISETQEFLDRIMYHINEMAKNAD